MDDSEILTATEASRSFSELLHRVCYGGQSFIIKKGNRLMARIVPVEPVAQEKDISADTAMDTLLTSSPAPDMTGGEAEFYRAWIEQVRKVGA